VPKIFGREIKTVYIVAVGAVAAYLAYGAIFPPPDATRTTPPRRATAAKKKVDQYRDSDYTVRYASVGEPIRDSFKPLIIRDDARNVKANPGGIPAAFAAGDGSWVYSGMATVNGVPQALLENRSNGDAEFVTGGQRWKTATIGRITADTLTLTGPGGMVQTLAAGGPSEPSVEESVSADQTVAPVTVPPGMVGRIGGGMSVQPANPNNNNGGRNNRRRRNNNNAGSGN
jgi:hypothetical protein